MNSSTQALPVRQALTSSWTTRLADYAELTKVRILTLVLVTVCVAAIVAHWGQPNLWLLLHTLVGTTLVAASASSLNQWLERDYDARMERTRNRPLPAGRISAAETLTLAAATVLGGTIYLILFCGWQTAFWAIATWTLYVGVYTPLKRKSWLNTAVGAVPGALPVLIGWTGSGASLDWRALCLFLVVFLWQFPHFMAIAWLYRRQYEQAEMKMLTVVDTSGYRAGVQATAAAFSLLLVTLLIPIFMASQSYLYVASSLALGLYQLAVAIGFLRVRHTSTARKLLRTSLLYLPLQLGLITLLTMSVLG